MKKKLLIVFALFSSLLKADVGTNFYKLDQESKKILLKGGLSVAEVYKVVDGNGMTYVLKDISCRPMADRIREIDVHKIASDHGYGPYLHAYDLKEGKIFMSLLEHSQKILTEYSKKQIIMSMLVESLKKMHNGPAFSEHISIIDEAKYLYSKVNYYPKGLDKNKISNLLDEISREEVYPKKPTHTDLTPANMFFTDEGVKFIDFEHARQEDSFFDLASIIVFFRYNEREEQEFLKLYFGDEISENDQKHLKIMKKAVLLSFGLRLLFVSSDVQLESDEPILGLREVFDKIDSGSLNLENKENVKLVGLAFLKDAIADQE